MSPTPRLSVDHLDYLIEQLPTFEEPLSPAMIALLSLLKFQRGIHSGSQPPPKPSTSKESSNPAKSSRGDKRVSTVADGSAKKRRLADTDTLSSDEDYVDDDIAPPKKKTCAPPKKKTSAPPKRKTHSHHRAKRAVPDVAWTTVKSPLLRPEVTSLLVSLSTITADSLQLELDNFLVRFKSKGSSASTIHTPATVADLFHHCDSSKSESDINDIFHMISLVQLAFYLDR
jgi:hypothetical protein